MKGKHGVAVGAVLVLVSTGGMNDAAANPEGWLTSSVTATPSVTLTPSASTGEERQYGDPRLGDFRIEGAPAEMLVAECASVAPARLVLQEELAGRRYDVRVSGAYGDPDETLLPVLRREFFRQTGFTFWLEQRTTEVLVLRTPSGRGTRLREAGAGETIRLEPGRVQAARATMGRLANSLERMLGVPVVDETGLVGEHSFQLNWDERCPEMVAAAIRDQLGLELKRERREIYMVVAGRQDIPGMR